MTRMITLFPTNYSDQSPTRLVRPSDSNRSPSGNWLPDRNRSKEASCAGSGSLKGQIQTFDKLIPYNRLERQADWVRFRKVLMIKLQNIGVVVCQRSNLNRNLNLPAWGFLVWSAPRVRPCLTLIMTRPAPSMLVWPALT